MSDTKFTPSTDYWVLKTPTSKNWIIQSVIQPTDYCYFQSSHVLRNRNAVYLNNESAWMFDDGNLVGKYYNVTSDGSNILSKMVIATKEQLNYIKPFIPKNEWNKIWMRKGPIWYIPRDEMWNGPFKKFFSESAINDPEHDRIKRMYTSLSEAGTTPYDGSKSKPFVQDEDGQRESKDWLKTFNMCTNPIAAEWVKTIDKDLIEALKKIAKYYTVKLDEDSQFRKVNEKQKETLDKECREGNITYERFNELVFSIVEPKPTELSDEEFEKLKEQIRNTPITFGDRKHNYIPYQLCPKCQGTGYIVPDNFHSTSIAKVTCNVCSGKMIIPMYKP